MSSSRHLGALLLAATLGGTGGTSVAHAARVTGRVELQAAGDSLRSGEVRDAVVYFKPRHLAPVRPISPAPEVRMSKKAFVPHVVAVTVGSSVRFPNSDPILHNVFSVSGDNAFDLGLYPEGPGKAATFHSAGLVRVFCNVHQTMVAYVLVLDTPYFVAPAADGSFALEGVPESDGLLVVWHDRAEPWSVELRPGATEPLVVRLVLTKLLVAAHNDKHGKPYEGTSSDAKSYR